MVTKRDKATDFAERNKPGETDGMDQLREQWRLRAVREAPADDIDPASMVHPPHSKPKFESETKIIGAHAGDPRVIAANAVDTPTEGTETPWRDTPPTNVSSVFETDNDHSPPHDPDVDPEDLDAQREEDVPPEAQLEELKKQAVERFPPEQEAGRQPAPRPKLVTAAETKPRR